MSNRHKDGMNIVDDINERSNQIAHKVLEIQQKLENVLAAETTDTDTQISLESDQNPIVVSPRHATCLSRLI